MENKVDIEKRNELLLELCKEQSKTLKFINQIMFKTTKQQLGLSEKEVNSELLDLAWSTNDVIVDNPRRNEIISLLKDEYQLEL